VKIAIIGYGKMGKQIENIAAKEDTEVIAIIDNELDWQVQSANLKKADAALEFSTPHTAYENIVRCLESGVPVVSGTTGWLGKYDEVSDLCKKLDGAFLFAANFSLGMNIFFHMNKELARIMDRYGEYDISIEETHHLQKIDKPSGTAIKLAEDIISANKRKVSWTNETTNNPGTLNIISIRKDEVTGSHRGEYKSCFD
jgi:4-hydroxy-tetrahydrodipicolinate reductase